ncbi:MAG: molecular chaperone TorD family protein [Candidatus Rokubacteria bacterium]|nr:molecular chaperone TorD family protein [Candidatus Rokubacteria bacterium]
MWEALALGFRPPTDETVARLASDEGARALAAAAALLDVGGKTGLAARVRGLARREGLAALENCFRRLFGHTARGAVPPYETEYGENSLFLPAQEMADLAAFYRAFSLTLSAGAHERSDHIACQCEFLLVLTRKEAYALERDDSAMAEAAGRAARLFLRDHLGRWGPAFGGKLSRSDPDGFYGAMGELFRAFVMHECARLGVAAGPEFLRLRAPLPDNAPMGCQPLTSSPLPSGER